MFRDLLLSGGISFDVTQLFSTEKADNYVWLAAALLNTKYLASLSTYIQLKKQMVIFVETEIVPTLVNQAQQGNTQFIINIVKFMVDKLPHNPEYLYTVEYFLKKMIDPGEDYAAEDKPVLKIDDFKTIYKYVKGGIADSLLEDNDLEVTIQMELFTKVLRLLAYYIMDEQTISGLF